MNGIESMTSTELEAASEMVMEAAAYELLKKCKSLEEVIDKLAHANWRCFEMIQDSEGGVGAGVVKSMTDITVRTTIALIKVMQRLGKEL